MYLVFAGAQYYPRGGWSDFIDKHAALADAKCSVEVVGSPAGKEYKIGDSHYGWYQIVNARTLKVVEEHG